MPPLTRSSSIKLKTKNDQCKKIRSTISIQIQTPLIEKTDQETQTQMDVLEDLDHSKSSILENLEEKLFIERMYHRDLAKRFNNTVMMMKQCKLPNYSPTWEWDKLVPLPDKLPRPSHM